MSVSADSVKVAIDQVRESEVGVMDLKEGGCIW